MKTTEQNENILDCVQYTECLQHKNAACECFSHKENALNNYKYTPEDNTETESDNGDYHAINDSESPNDTVNELIKPDLTDAGNKYFHVGNIETNIDTMGCELSTLPRSCYEKLVHASDILPLTKCLIYQKDEFVQPAYSDIGGYIDLKATDADSHLYHDECIDTDDYLHPVATGIDDHVHVHTTSLEKCIMPKT